MLSFDFIVNKGDQVFCTGCNLKLNPAISIFTDESIKTIGFGACEVDKD